MEIKCRNGRTTKSKYPICYSMFLLSKTWSPFARDGDSSTDVTLLAGDNFVLRINEHVKEHVATEGAWHGANKHPIANCALNSANSNPRLAGTQHQTFQRSFALQIHWEICIESTDSMGTHVVKCVAWTKFSGFQCWMLSFVMSCYGTRVHWNPTVKHSHSKH